MIRIVTKYSAMLGNDETWKEAKWLVVPTIDAITLETKSAAGVYNDIDCIPFMSVLLLVNVGLRK